VSTEERVPATLTAFGAPPVAAVATVVSQTRAERITRALAALGAFWALALVALFIPVAHFILVPTLVIVGIVAAVRRGREARRLVNVRGTCPRCGVERRFDVGGRFGVERAFDCPWCHNILRLRPPSP
jgi:hypothetical protein